MSRPETTETVKAIEVTEPIEAVEAGPVVRCLYCGSTEDIYEVPTTIDERTSGYALHCGLCGGVWTQ
jgi:transcription elongation factor Elf1